MAEQAAETVETTTEAPAAEETLLTGETEATTTETSTETTEETTEEASTEATEEEVEKPEGAPEEYADFTMPEGMALDEDIAAELKALGKEKNWTQDEAQQIADLGAKLQQRNVDAILAVRQDWLDKSKADPEFGGDDLAENLGIAKRALDAYGTPELVQFFNETGLGNQPEIVRFIWNAGKAVSEDKAVRGSNDSTGERTLANRIFSGSKKE